MSESAYTAAPSGERHHFFDCGVCGEKVDARDLDEVLQHETHAPQPDMPYSHSIKTAPTGEFASLTRVPGGDYRCRKWYQFTKRRGWLSVGRKGDGTTSIMWLSHRESHHPWYGPALIVELDTEGNLTAYYEAYRTIHLKWGHGRGDETRYQKALVEARWMATILHEYHLP